MRPAKTKKSGDGGEDKNWGKLKHIVDLADAIYIINRAHCISIGKMRTTRAKSHSNSIGNLIDAILHLFAGRVIENDVLSVGTNHL